MNTGREDLEREHAVSRDAVAAALAAKRDALAPLMALERRVSALWQKRRAMEESLRITRNAALNCGLGSSPLVANKIRDFQLKIDGVREEIRTIIASAQPVCETLDARCAELAAARDREVASLKALMALSVETDSEDASETREAVRRELDQSELSRRKEILEREELDSWKDKGKFDPQYDPWEIARRRARPWV